MDDVFRKAAEEYPLDTRSMDWNKVLTALQQNDEPPEPPKNNRYRRLTWLLLLLPLYLICNEPATPLRDSTAGKQGATDHKEMVSKNGGGARKEPSATGEGTGRATVREGSSVSKDKSSEATKVPASGDVTKATDHNGDHQTAAETGKGGKLSHQSSIARTKKAVVSAKTAHQKQLLAGSEQPTAGSGETGNESFKALPSDNSNRAQYRGLMELTQRSFVKQTCDFNRQDIVSTLPSRPPALPRQPRLYLALMAGVDLTTIKMQRTDDVGYDYGGLVGYDLGKRWSVEAGLFMDQKSYYSDGKYLTTKKVYRPPNSEITDITGTCRMFDISLGGKYALRKKTASTLFVAGGISSYIMKKEDYAYTYYYLQTGQVYLYEHTYKNESRNILSIANLSVGYTKKLGKVAELRLEPYVKIPLGGVGYGELPLLSTGIRAGFVRRLF